MEQKSSSKSSIVIAVVLIAALATGIYKSRDILDFIALRNYQAPAQVAQLADQTTMADHTRKVFYVNHPEIQEKQQFKTSCTQAEQTIVLGCFISNDGIYLLQVEDQRLEGVLQVTAAHEVLHAMYDRLNAKDRQRIDGLTQQYFSTTTDERIKKTVENYRKKDASIVPNELHSILGTEVRDLPPDLEAYYARYFKDRKAIVAFSEKYEQTFVSLENQVNAYDQELRDIKATIDVNQGKLKASEDRIDSEKNRLDQLIAQKNVEEYNQSVSSFNALVNSHNALIRETQGLVERYNKIVEDRNALATTEAQLVQAIDANSIPKQQ